MTCARRNADRFGWNKPWNLESRRLEPVVSQRQAFMIGCVLILRHRGQDGRAMP